MTDTEPTFDALVDAVRTLVADAGGSAAAALAGRLAEAAPERLDLHLLHGRALAGAPGGAPAARDAIDRAATLAPEDPAAAALAAVAAVPDGDSAAAACARVEQAVVGGALEAADVMACAHLLAGRDIPDWEAHLLPLLVEAWPAADAPYAFARRHVLYHLEAVEGAMAWLTAMRRVHGELALANDQALRNRLTNPPLNVTLHTPPSARAHVITRMAAESHRLPLIGRALERFFRAPGASGTDRVEPGFEWAVEPLASRVFRDIPEPGEAAIRERESRMMPVKVPALGDLAMALEALAVNRYQAPEANIYLMAELDTPIKAALLLFAPFVDHLVLARPVPSLTVFEVAYYQAPYTPAGRHLRNLDRMVPLPDPFRFQPHRAVLSGLDNQQTLEVPDALAEAALPALERLGLDPGHWYVCLHVRHGSYRGLADTTHPRSIAHVDRYETLIQHIVDDLGGQVVILGDTSMEFSAAINRPGVVSLYHVPDSLLLQLTALAGARFMVGTDSGPASLAHYLGVPVAHTNVLNLGIGRGCPIAMSLSKWVRVNGRWLADAEAEAAGVLAGASSTETGYDPEGMAIAERSTADLIAATEAMMAETPARVRPITRPSIARPVNPGAAAPVAPSARMPVCFTEHPVFRNHRAR